MSQTAAKFTPGPKGLPLIGSIGTLRAKGPFDFWFDLWQEYGDVARAQMGPQILMQFVRPEHVQYILVKNKDNYIKGLSHETLLSWPKNAIRTKISCLPTTNPFG